MKRLLCITSLTIALSASGYAADVQIIANDAVKDAALSSDELKRIFLETKSSLSDGSRVEPVLGTGGATHDAFLREYIGKTDTALRSYYKSLVFTGKGSIPKSFATDSEVISYVAKTKGAVGYVSASANPSGVKRISVK